MYDINFNLKIIKCKIVPYTNCYCQGSRLPFKNWQGLSALSGVIDTSAKNINI